MFKKILRILTYHGDGDNICGDWVGMGTLVMGMGWGWGQDAWGWGGDGVVSLSPCQSLFWTNFGLKYLGSMPVCQSLLKVS